MNNNNLIKLISKLILICKKVFQIKSKKRFLKISKYNKGKMILSKIQYIIRIIK